MSNEEMVLCYQGTNDPEKRRKLMEDLYSQNKGLLAKVAIRYQAFDAIEDLMQEGYFGLVRAVELWSPEGGSNFATYALKWIRQAVQSYLFNRQRTIRLPVYLYKELHEFHQFRDDFERQHGRRPSDKEIVSGLHISFERLDVLKTADACADPVSINKALGDENELTLEETIADPNDPIGKTVEQIQREFLAKDINDAVEQLPDREGSIIRSRFFDGKTFKVCASELGVSQARAQQLEKEALKRLRSPRYSKRLRQYLDDIASGYGYSRSGLTRFRNTGLSSVEAAVFKIESITNKHDEDR